MPKGPGETWSKTSIGPWRIANYSGPGVSCAGRIEIVREQFTEHPRAGRWPARFFTYRNARCYADRFKARPEILRRCLGLGRVPLTGPPNG